MPLLPGNSYALPAELHAIIAYEASLVSAVPPEIRVYAGDPEHCIRSLDKSICSGAYDEDADRDPRISGLNPSTLLGLLNWGTHFWQPDAGPDGGRLDSVAGLPVNLDSQNAYQRARMLYDTAKALYVTDPFSAYHTLGRVAHLLADMAVPAHVHLDPHISDASVTGDDSFEEYTGQQYVYPGNNAGITAFERDFPVGDISTVSYLGLPDGGYHEEPVPFRLFYSMAEMSNNYDSDDADGKTDAGSRRGVSVKVAHAGFEQVFVLRSGRPDELLQEGYGTSPARDKFILLNSALEMLERAAPPYEGVKLVFSDGVEVHALTEFTKTDMTDADTARLEAVLIPAALDRTASLYQLFWQDTHPLLGDNMAAITLNNGSHRLPVKRPGAIDLKIDIDARGWTGTGVEVYAWAALQSSGSVLRFYFDGQWHLFTDLSEIRPALTSYSFADLHDALWTVLDNTAAVPETDFSVNICIDRVTDGRYTPQESLCNGVLVTVGP